MFQTLSINEQWVEMRFLLKLGDEWIIQFRDYHLIYLPKQWKPIYMKQFSQLFCMLVKLITLSEEHKLLVLENKAP
jgi:hypothetical protein